MLEWFTQPHTFLALVIWTLVWKSVSLWRSARRGQRIWFGVLLVTNTLGILDAVYIFLVNRDKHVGGRPSFSEKLDRLITKQTEKRKPVAKK